MLISASLSMGVTLGSRVWEVERGREGGPWASAVEASWDSRGWLGLEVMLAEEAVARASWRLAHQASRRAMSRRLAAGPRYRGRRGA